MAWYLEIRHACRDMYAPVARFLQTEKPSSTAPRCSVIAAVASMHWMETKLRNWFRLSLRVLDLVMNRSSPLFLPTQNWTT
jgi:hypothetical protein